MDFIDLKTQYRRLKQPIWESIRNVLEHGQFIMGPEVAELEKRLSALAGVRHCISCSSGTDALVMPLMAWGIGPGDAVFVPAFTFFATAEAVAILGAVPVIVDIDIGTFTMDAAKLEAAVGAVESDDPSLHPLPCGAGFRRLRPRAVIPVDLFGLAADYDRILRVAGRHGMKVLEDAAQSFGGTRNGMPNAGLGCDAAATSFFPAKPLGCYGDGGAIFTDDDDLALTLRSIRSHGKGNHKYDNVRIGLNGRLDTLQAAVLLVKLSILADEIAARDRTAQKYARGLSGATVTTPRIPDGCQSAWAQYTILHPDRDAAAASLKSAGVPTAVYYSRPLHRQPALAYLGYEEADFPAAVDASRRALSLPMHPYLADSDIDMAVGRLVAGC